MLAHPHRSTVVLVNPSRVSRAALSQFTERWQSGLTLLLKVQGLLNFIVHTVGCFDPRHSGDAHCHADTHSLRVCRPEDLNSVFGKSGVEVVFIGGCWFEEEVSIAALQVAHLGYDVRVLLDLSVSRLESDRSWACSRLTMHGIVPTSVRQTMLEWAVSLADPALSGQIDQLLQ